MQIILAPTKNSSKTNKKGNRNKFSQNTIRREKFDGATTFERNEHSGSFKN